MALLPIVWQVALNGITHLELKTTQGTDALAHILCCRCIWLALVPHCSYWLWDSKLIDRRVVEFCQACFVSLLNMHNVQRTNESLCLVIFVLIFVKSSLKMRKSCTYQLAWLSRTISYSCCYLIKIWVAVAAGSGGGGEGGGIDLHVQTCSTSNDIGAEWYFCYIP